MSMARTRARLLAVVAAAVLATASLGIGAVVAQTERTIEPTGPENSTQTTIGEDLDVQGILEIVPPSDDARLRLTDPSGQIWEIQTDLDDFAVLDLSGGAFPFFISDGAPNNSLTVGSDGNVGMGLFNPGAPLDLLTSAAGPGNAVLRLSRTGGPVAFQLNDTDTGDFWNITMTDGADEFRFSRSGTGQREMALTQAGNMTITGTLTQGSDAARKVDLRPVDTTAVLDAVTGLPLSTWQYAADPGVTHLGPTAQDFAAAFDLGATTTGIASVDADGVALAAIQALAEENVVLRAQVAVLEARIKTLEAGAG